MSALVWTVDGLHAFAVFGGTLQAFLNTLTLRCYQNVFAPLVTSTTADFLESTFPGYAAVPFSGWSGPTNDPNNNQQLMHPEIDYTTSAGSGQSINGVYATNGVGKTIFAQATSAPYPMPAAGLTFAVFPMMYLGQIAFPL